MVHGTYGDSTVPYFPIRLLNTIILVRYYRYLSNEIKLISKVAIEVCTQYK